MRFCSKCGVGNESSTLCKKCGSNLEKTPFQTEKSKLALTCRVNFFLGLIGLIHSASAISSWIRQAEGLRALVGGGCLELFIYYNSFIRNPPIFMLFIMFISGVLFSISPFVMIRDHKHIVTHIVGIIAAFITIMVWYNYFGFFFF